MRRIVGLALIAGALGALWLPAQAPGGSLVPLRATDTGTWGVGTHDCGARVPVRVDGSGGASATHLGRLSYSSRECVDFGSYPFPYTGTFVLRASNGDTVVGSYAGTASLAADGVTILYQQTATVTGGTGRFDGASGAFHVDGVAFADGSYVQELSGAITSAGAAG